MARNAMRAWDEQVDFRGLVEADADVAGRVDLDAVFDPAAFTLHGEVVFERLNDEITLPQFRLAQ